MWLRMQSGNQEELHGREAGDWHWIGSCRVAPDRGTQVEELACVWRLGSVRFVIFLRVSIIITTEHLVCVDISPSVALTQSEWHFFFSCKKLVSKYLRLCGPKGLSVTTSQLCIVA